MAKKKQSPKKSSALTPQKPTVYRRKAVSDKVLEQLNNILQTELSGVVRYLHYSLTVTGLNRIPIVQFFKGQATESLLHATIIGEKIVSLGGHPSLKVNPVPENDKHSDLELLEESLDFERSALALYVALLPLCSDNIALEELIRGFVKTEQEHVEEVEKMLGY